MMADRLDDILKQALTPGEEPAEKLNQRILCRVKEEERGMKQNRETGWSSGERNRQPGRRRFPAAVIAAALTLGVGSITALAAAKLLMPAQVTEQLGNDKLTDSFLGEDAIIVNETQSFGGYDVTFMGIASGKGISDSGVYADGSLREDRSYMVVSIANSDGTPMPETSSDEYDLTEFFVSPLIQGCDPVWYNTAAFGGAMTETVVDGVRYRLTECDNVEIFADRELYLGVMNGALYNSGAYVYDVESGKIARNEGYEGLNALFRLPIDPAKADPEAAKAYLEHLDGDGGPSSVSIGPVDGNTGTDGNAAVGDGAFEEEEIDFDEVMREQLGEEGYRKWRAVEDWYKQLTPENLDEYAVPVESTRQVLTPDADGYITFWDYEVEGRSGGKGGRIKADWLFKHADAENPMVLGGYNSSGTMDTVVVETYTRNEDGTVTFVAYIPDPHTAE